MHVNDFASGIQILNRPIDASAQSPEMCEHADAMCNESQHEEDVRLSSAFRRNMENHRPSVILVSKSHAVDSEGVDAKSSPTVKISFFGEILESKET